MWGGSAHPPPLAAACAHGGVGSGGGEGGASRGGGGEGGSVCACSVGRSVPSCMPVSACLPAGAQAKSSDIEFIDRRTVVVDAVVAAAAAVTPGQQNPLPQCCRSPPSVRSEGDSTGEARSLLGRRTSSPLLSAVCGKRRRGRFRSSYSSLKEAHAPTEIVPRRVLPFLRWEGGKQGGKQAAKLAR